MKYKCPSCKEELIEMAGEGVHPGNRDYGVLLECQNLLCPSKEVQGHGKNAQGAYEVIMSKRGRVVETA
jgi:hypothetical protein